MAGGKRQEQQRRNGFEWAGLTAPNHQPDFSGVSEFLSVANHFFPVAEMFALLTVISITWLIMISYRLVKSWIPTLS